MRAVSQSSVSENPGQAVTLVCDDGQSLGATAFAATADPPIGTAVIAPAMGVPQAFYARFAGWLATRGIDALTFDYRGIGASRLISQRGREVTLLDWGRADLEAVLRHAVTPSDRPVFLIGHSMGGQLAGLAPSSERLAAFVFIAASLPHWRLWPGARKYALGAAWYALVPLLSTGHDRFPARRLGFSSVDIPSGATMQWARWGRQRRYLFSPALGLDTERYRSLSQPLLAYIADDDPYCPEAAARALLAEYPSAPARLVRVTADAVGGGPIGHFGFFREKMREPVWREIAQWLHAQAQGSLRDG